MSILRHLFYKFPPASRLFLRRLWFLPVDIWESISGKRPDLAPPRGMIFTGSGAFLEQGERFLKYFIEWGGLRPEHKVLDIGSGIGRMAIPLTTYLSENGEYQGFDIVRAGVQWCRRKISSRYPNFHFRQVDLRNDLYRSSGERAEDFQFPYPDGYFDFAFLTSVFTHMLPDEIENYLNEIERVLKPGGRCLCTFFILDPAEKIENPAFRFPYDHGSYRTMSRDSRAANVAYQLDYLRAQVEEKRNFDILKIQNGYWRKGNRDKEPEFQDIMVFNRR